MSSSPSGEESLHFFRQLVSRTRSAKGKTWTLADLVESRTPPDGSPSGGGGGSQKKAKPRSTSLVRLLSGSRASETSSSTATSPSHSPSPTFKAQAAAAKESFAPPLWLPLVDYLCRFIELHGRDKLGIFRLSGNARTVGELTTACGDLIAKKAGEEDMQKLFEPYADGEVHVVASVLKAYLREQKEPLLPASFYDSFISAAETTDAGERLAQLKDLISKLPEGRRNILHRLVQSLVLIAENSEENKMDASNLAIVFGPSLLKAESDGLDILFKIRAQCLVVENCILHHATIFLGHEVRQQDIENDRKSPRSNGASDDDDDDDLSLDKLAKEMEEAEKESRDFDTAIEEFPQEAEEPTMQSHAFKKEAFNPFSPTMCRHCRKYIFGIRKSYLCKNCNFPTHGKCRKSVGKTCPGSCEKTTKQKKPEPINVGQKVPLFTLKDGKGKTYSIEDSLRLNKRIVLFFYPKDFTPGCTRENKAFRDQFSLFHYADCEIVGISGDSSACHSRFAAKYNIPFRLLSDPKSEVREQFGVPDSMGGLAPGRVTYVIDPSGTVVHVYNSLFNPQEHLVHSLHAISQMLLHDLSSPAAISAAS